MRANAMLFRLSLLFLVPLSIVSCGVEEGQRADTRSQSISVPLPAGMHALGSVGYADYVIHVIIDGNYDKPYVLTDLRYDAERDVLVGDTKITLAARPHQVEVIYYLNDSRYGLIEVARTASATVVVVKGENTPVPFSADGIAYHDDDGDGVSNFDELLRQSDPNSRESVPASLPTTPSGLTLTAAATGFNLHWNPVAGVKYKVYYGTSSTLATGVGGADLVVDNNWSLDMSDRDFSTRYYFAVSAVDDAFKPVKGDSGTMVLESALSAVVDGVLCQAQIKSVSALPVGGGTDGIAACFIVQGLAGGQTYVVGLSDVSAASDLVAFGEGSARCAADGATQQDEYCVTASGADGTIRVNVRNRSPGNNVTFTLNALAVTDLTRQAMPFRSSLASQSDARLYLMTGLTANASYVVKGDNYAGDATVAGDLSVFRLPFAAVDCTTYVTEACFAQANDRGELFFRPTLSEAYQGTSNAIDFSVAPTPVMPVAADFHFYNNIPIHAKTETSNDGANLAYLVNSLTPAADYLVTLDGLSGDVDLYVYGANFNRNFLCGSASEAAANEYCLVRGVPAASLYVNATPYVEQVGASYKSATSGFDIAVFPVTTLNYAVDGQFVADDAFDGMGLRDRLYVYDGLQDSGDYYVYLWNLNADADLIVYNEDPTKNGSPLYPPAPFNYYDDTYHCLSDLMGSSDEACNATATAAGELFVRVRPLAGNISFRMVAMQRVGTSVHDTIHSSLADDSTTDEFRFYVFAGLDPATTYTFTLNIDNAAMDLDLYAYSDAAFRNQIAASDQVGTSTETVTVRPSAAGTLYFIVDPWGMGNNSFTLSR